MKYNTIFKTGIILMIIIIVMICIYNNLIIKKTNNKIKDTNTNPLLLINNINNKGRKQIKEEFTDDLLLDSDAIFSNFNSEKDNILNLDDYGPIIVEKFNNKLTEIENIFKEIEQKINNVDTLNKLPIGTVIMWNGNKLPTYKVNGEEKGTKWIWCDGNNGEPYVLENGENMYVPDLKYKFALGGKGEGDNTSIPKEIQPNDGKIRKENITGLFDDDYKIKYELMPNHTHKIGNNFPSLSHNHGGNTAYDGKHYHLSSKKNIYRSIPYYMNVKEPWGIIHTGTIRSIYIDRWWTKTSWNKGHNHNISNDLDSNHYEVKKIANHKISDSIWQESGINKNNTPFYPEYTLVNFIMKVKE